MPTISYAQNFEDVMLWRALKNIDNGFYIDIGANDPVVDSVSLLFYENGWRGVHVEPTQQYSDKLAAARPDEDVEQVAVGLREGSTVFYEFENTGLSTTDIGIAKRHCENGFSLNETIVNIIPLSVIFDKYCDREIHWIKIDVEGCENEVIKSWGNRKVRPWVVVVESTEPLSKCESFHEWEPILLEKGYKFVYFDGVNRFYVHESHSDLFDTFAAPPNFHDNFVLDSSHYLCAFPLAELKSREVDVADLKHALSKVESREKNLVARIERISDESIFLKQQLEQKNSEIGCFKQQIEQRSSEVGVLKQQLEQIELQLTSVYESRSWRVTAPVRLLFSRVRDGVTGLEAWLRFYPNSKPRQYLYKIMKKFYLYVTVRPKLRNAVLLVIRKFPRVYNFLRNLLKVQLDPILNREDAKLESSFDFNKNSGELPLSVNGQRYYQKLICSIKERE